jgi:hypothetical protein
MFSRTRIGVAVCFMIIAFTGMTSLLRADDKPADTGVTGTWKWTRQGPNGDQETVLKLKQDGDKLTGTVSGFNGNDDDITDGKVTDGKVTFKVVRDFGGRQVTTNYTAELKDGVLKGKSETVFGQDFEAKRSDDK